MVAIDDCGSFESVKNRYGLHDLPMRVYEELKPLLNKCTEYVWTAKAHQENNYYVFTTVSKFINLIDEQKTVHQKGLIAMYMYDMLLNTHSGIHFCDTHARFKKTCLNKLNEFMGDPRVGHWFNQFKQ